MGENVTVTNVVEFIQAIAEVPKRNGSIHSFRGQRDSEWMDNPALLRGEAKLLPHEYSAVRDLLSVQPQQFQNDTNMFDKLVRMQHYGLPTRLLDVTSNPLVALYFATEPMRSRSRKVSGRVYIYDIPADRRKYFDSDSVSCLSNLANLNDVEKRSLLNGEELNTVDFNKLKSCDRLVQFIRSEKSHFRAEVLARDLVSAFYVIPKMQNSRIIAQHGAFVIFGLRIVRRHVVNANPNSMSRSTVDIPQASKPLIRRELDGLGINNATLFPELTHAASEIVRRYTN